MKSKDQAEAKRALDQTFADIGGKPQVLQVC
jgi:hypothetical protein